jgi:hypothetical protein
MLEAYTVLRSLVSGLPIAVIVQCRDVKMIDIAFIVWVAILLCHVLY